jgi:hypothetical protein
MPVDLFGALKLVASPLASLVGRWRRIRVSVHVAHMKGDPNPMAFVNVVNLSSGDVEIRRVWFDVDPPVDVRNDSERPLPPTAARRVLGDMDRPANVADEQGRRPSAGHPLVRQEGEVSSAA